MTPTDTINLKVQPPYDLWLITQFNYFSTSNGFEDKLS